MNCVIYFNLLVYCTLTISLCKTSYGWITIHVQKSILTSCANFLYWCTPSPEVERTLIPPLVTDAMFRKFIHTRTCWRHYLSLQCLANLYARKSPMPLLSTRTGFLAMFPQRIWLCTNWILYCVIQVILTGDYLRLN